MKAVVGLVIAMLFVSLATALPSGYGYGHESPKAVAVILTTKHTSYDHGHDYGHHHVLPISYPVFVPVHVHSHHGYGHHGYGHHY